MTFDHKIIKDQISIDSTVDCTFLEAKYELVTLFSIIFRVYTQDDGEGKSSLYLGETLVKFTQAPWRVTHNSHCKGNCMRV
jgi:hypothetical protein